MNSLLETILHRAWGALTARLRPGWNGIESCPAATPSPREDLDHTLRLNHGGRTPETHLVPNRPARPAAINLARGPRPGPNRGSRRRPTGLSRGSSSGSRKFWRTRDSARAAAARSSSCRVGSPSTGKLPVSSARESIAPRARITVDGEPIHLERMVYFAVNKPKGYVSTSFDPGGRPRVVDLLPEVPERVYTVGRLDEDSTGLMILTNDGDLANRLAHPRYGVEKLYRALVAGLPDREMLTKLTEGIWLSDGKVRAKRARIVGRQGQATNARAGTGRRQEARDPPDAVQARAQGDVTQPDRGRSDQSQGAPNR